LARILLQPRRGRRESRRMLRRVIFITCFTALGLAGCSPRCALDATDHWRSSADLEITRQIRQTLLAPNDLSLGAKNVTIVTNACDVTLRGVVANDDERRELVAIARAFAAGRRVSEDLEVQPD
jgi:hypothetical protein